MKRYYMVYLGIPGNTWLSKGFFTEFTGWGGWQLPIKKARFNERTS